MRLQKRFVIFAWFCATLPCLVTAQTPPAAELYGTDDPDYAVQGEYSGESHSMQVIAIGDGEFDIVVYDVPITQLGNSTSPPRRLDGDEDVVADLCDALDVKRVVRSSPTAGIKPPSGAMVLFDGSQSSLANWKGGKRTADGLLKQGTETKQTFRDYTLHLEFRTPWMPAAKGQARGNSGVYHQGRYETQILDSFGLKGQHNETGGIYEIKAPDVNACLPPLQWQTYDVDFTAARYRGDKKIADARMTVRLNGVVVQNDVAVPKATRAAKYAEGPEDGPIYLQDHGNEVRFRNIWIVKRDAQREATRPIIPGFERFFSATHDPHGLGGEILISTLGCTSCHHGATETLSSKSGPDLSNVAQRVRGDALVAMIADPHKAKRGTSMPDPWMGLNAAQRESAAMAIASFLSLENDQHQLVDRPSTPSNVKRGNELYHSVGCVACHAPMNGSKTPLATTVPLGDLATKYTVDSLAKLIADPHSIRPGGRMPSLVGSIGDAYAIASYLTRKVTQRTPKIHFRRRIYKGDWNSLPDFESLTPVHDDIVEQLDIKEPGKKDVPKHTAMVFDFSIRVMTQGDYEFSLSSDDGSRLSIGSQAISNDGIHAPSTKTGVISLDAGIHPVRIEWFNFEGGGSLNVQVKDPLLGQVKLRELVSDGKDEPETLLASQFRPDATLVEKGRGLFTSAGCASCHQFPGIQKAETNLPSLTDVRFGKGCLANSVSRPAVDYHLSPRQRAAIEDAIEQRRKSSGANALSDGDQLHLTMAGLNCYACHRRGDFGGPDPARDEFFKTTMVEMGWEGRLPPPLNGVGDKLQSTYMDHVVAKGANERPYMLTRMPGFGDGHLNHLSKIVARMDRQNADSDNASHTASEDQIQDGRKLVGASGLSCIKCHSYNEIKGGGIGAIDLLAMPKRLRGDWFSRYLQDPTKYRPGTRMPNSFPEGKSAYTKLYHGDPAQQIYAMWSYLSAGPEAKEPSGLRAGAILLAPTDRPRFYRNFFEGVSPRGIAVGFPEEVNLIWDAERMGLNTVWKNEFIDAARHWTGRGQGRTKPAGDNINTLETWTAIAKGDAIDMTWPSESGKEQGYRYRGYRLDASGNPTFSYDIDSVQIQDSIRPLGPGGFERKLTVAEGTQDAGIALIWRVARADSIKGTSGVFQVGSLNISIIGAQCQVIHVDGQDELRVKIPAGQPTSVTQTIQW